MSNLRLAPPAAILLASIALSAFASTAGEEGMPVVRAGLWEFKDTRPAVEETLEVCTADPIADYRTLLSRDQGEMCKAERLEIPGGFKIVAVCASGNMPATMETRFVGSDSAFEVVHTVRIADTDPTVVSRKARLLGPCSPG